MNPPRTTVRVPRRAFVRYMQLYLSKTAGCSPLGKLFQAAVAGRLGRFRMSHWFLCFQPPPPTPAAGPIRVCNAHAERPRGNGSTGAPIVPKSTLASEPSLRQ